MMIIEEEIKVDKLIEADRNPNRMDSERFEILKEAIRTLGFLQPILVTQQGGKEGTFCIVDGHHRVRAARELGIDSVPAVITEGDRAMLDATTLSMNRNRGEINLTVAAEILQELKMDGWSTEQMTVTGFTAEELSDLLSSGRSIEEDLLADAVASDFQEEEKESSSPFLLELLFATKDQLKAVKRALKSASATGEFSDGLLSVLGLQEE